MDERIINIEDSSSPDDNALSSAPPPGSYEQPSKPSVNSSSPATPRNQQNYPPAPGALLLDPGRIQTHPLSTSINSTPSPDIQQSNHPGFNNVSQGRMTATDDPVPSAPSLLDSERLIGYENSSFNAVSAPPPAYPEQPEQNIADRGISSNLPAFTEDQVREALFHHVSEQCCFGQSAAKEMVFNSLETSSAFHYKLVSFTERRETAWAYEPYNGQIIDSPQNGRPPLPWDIAVIAPPNTFTNAKAQVEVPHTALVKSCHACAAHGHRVCSSCNGYGEIFTLQQSFEKAWEYGWKVCTCIVGFEKAYGVDERLLVAIKSLCESPGSCVRDFAKGRGHITRTTGDNFDNRCIACDGRGRRKCNRCSGHGKILCATCEGSGRLKCFISLTVTWGVHSDDHVVERTALPDKFIKSVSGQVAFEEEHPRVWPVRHFPDQSINKASSDIINKHINNYPFERILMQRQQIRIIPVIQAFYQWHNQTGEFYVYGFEQKVYAPDYPQKCCWGCQIL